jgi:hypothetical protein
VNQIEYLRTDAQKCEWTARASAIEDAGSAAAHVRHSVEQVGTSQRSAAEAIAGCAQRLPEDDHTASGYGSKTERPAAARGAIEAYSASSRAFNEFMPASSLVGHRHLPSPFLDLHGLRGSMTKSWVPLRTQASGIVCTARARCAAAA